MDLIIILLGMFVMGVGIGASKFRYDHPSHYEKTPHCEISHAKVENREVVLKTCWSTVKKEYEPEVIKEFKTEEK